MQIDFKKYQNSKNLVANIQAILAIGVEKIKLAEAGKTWQQVFEPLDEFENLLNQTTSVQSHLNSVCFNEEYNLEYEKTLPLISDFYSELGVNKKLYQAFKNLENTNLNAKQKYILANVLRDFEHSGINLADKEQKQYKQLSADLSLLSNDFAKNSLKATNNYKKKVSITELSGLNEQELAKLKVGDEYILSLQIPQYMAVMTYCENRKLREELYGAYISRASEFDDFDNSQIMQNILIKRLELAHLLGFKDYANYSLTMKMVKEPHIVEDFLQELIQKSKNQAQKELQALKDFASLNKDAKAWKLKPWDVAFYSEKLKQQQYQVSKSEIAAYFPFTVVLDGLLTLIQDLYAVEVKIINEKTYHNSVVVLEFNGIGKVYLDPFARKDKRGGAWMNDYQGLNYKTQQKPIAFVVCNFNTANASAPSLLEFDDVITLFHEFGHALHHLLTTVNYPSVAGINGVPWDGVELPSQYMEFFAYENSVIKQISSHYQTKEQLPEVLFNKLIAGKNFQSGLGMLRQCEFALWDIFTHQAKSNADINPYLVLDKVRKQTTLLEPTANNRFLNSFGHIFAGGYASGYYSYKWAEVMAADAYSIVKQDKTKIQSFRKNILATGGQSDFMENYQKFSGRIPKIDALLKASSIK